MIAGVIFLFGLLAIWVGVTGRGNRMWDSLTAGTSG